MEPYLSIDYARQVQKVQLDRLPLQAIVPIVELGSIVSLLLPGRKLIAQLATIVLRELNMLRNIPALRGLLTQMSGSQVFQTAFNVHKGNIAEQDLLLILIRAHTERSALLGLIMKFLKFGVKKELILTKRMGKLHVQRVLQAITARKVR